MYRPSDWELGNIRHEAIDAYLKSPDVPPVQQGSIYEKWLINAGADAMLEVVNNALVPLGMSFTSDGLTHKGVLDNQFPNANWAEIVREWAHRYGKSKIIFIPEEE